MKLPRVIIKASAQWCHPCKTVQPKYEALEQNPTYGAYVFYIVDIDEMPSFCENINVSSLPTFLTFHGGVEQGRVVGANIEKVEQLLTSPERADVEEPAEDKIIELSCTS